MDLCAINATIHAGSCRAIASRTYFIFIAHMKQYVHSAIQYSALEVLTTTALYKFTFLLTYLIKQNIYFIAAFILFYCTRNHTLTRKTIAKP